MPLCVILIITDIFYTIYYIYIKYLYKYINKIYKPFNCKIISHFFLCSFKQRKLLIIYSLEEELSPGLQSNRNVMQPFLGLVCVLC